MHHYKERKMKHLTKIVLLFFFVSTAIAENLTCNWPTEQILNSIVAIQSGENSHASGVVISNNLVITAAHALEDYEDTSVNINNTMYLATILLVDRESDVALLSVQTENLYPIPLSRVALNDSQDVWAAGYPRAQNLLTTSVALFLK